MVKALVATCSPRATFALFAKERRVIHLIALVSTYPMGADDVGGTSATVKSRAAAAASSSSHFRLLPCMVE